MYQEYFGLHDRPFKPAPAAKQYVACQAIEHARQTIHRGIDQGAGPALVVGPAGSGKSLLAQVIADQLRDKYHVALLNSARLDSCRTLLQSILFEVRLPYRELEEGEMRLSLIDFLRSAEASPGLLLLIDEAHTLPLRLLEEIRLITNIADQGTPRVQLVLFGGAQLEERFASPKLEAFNQRIASRSYLQALNHAETTRYVREQIKLVGGNGSKLFDDATANAVYRATDGIPRLINQICDHALMLTFIAGGKAVTPEAIEEAWADLQQIPAPWQAPRTEATFPAAKAEVENVLEFGMLEDDFPVASSAAAHQRIEDQLDYLTNSVQAFHESGLVSENFDIEEPIGPAIELNFLPSVSQLTGGSTEITIEAVIHDDQRAADIFGTFEEEEPITDRYAQLDAASQIKPATKPAKRLPNFNVPFNQPQVLGETFSYSPQPPVYEDTAPGIVTSSWDDAPFVQQAQSSIDLPVERFIAMIDAIDVALDLDNIEPMRPITAAKSEPVVAAAATEEPTSPAHPFNVVHQSEEAEFDPADDPVLPEVINIEGSTPPASSHDDRDLLVIEGGRNPRSRTANSGRGRYRQLFSNLRRREGTG